MRVPSPRSTAQPTASRLATVVASSFFLLGAGLTEFSMHTSILLRLKREILGANISRLVPKVRRILSMGDPLRVRVAVERLAAWRIDGPGEARFDARAPRGDERPAGVGARVDGGRGEGSRGDGRPTTGLAEQGA